MRPQFTSRLAEINLRQATLERHSIARDLGQGVKHSAPQLGSRKAVGKLALDRQRLEPRGRRAAGRLRRPGTAATVFLSIALFTALSGSPVSTAASVGVNRVSCVCILILLYI
jgi:hypothetical protein